VARVKINIKDGTIQRQERVIGIDLGTTNSLIALVDASSKQAYCIEEDGDCIVPSVVYFDQDQTPLVGKAAKAHLLDQPGATIYSVKRLLGRSYTDVMAHAQHYAYHLVPDDGKQSVQVTVNGKSYHPIELSAMVLKALKTRAEKALNEPIKKAVITVPAYFNDSQRQATRDAGKLAGLDVLRIVNEPTAASLAYGIGLDPNEQKTIAVYDLGGGTFDVTLLSIQQGVFEVLSTNGDTYTGGDDFDHAILKHWAEQLHITANTLSQNKTLYSALRVQAEQAKIHLSQADQFNSTLEVAGNTYATNISKTTFDSLIQPIVNSTIKACQDALNDAGLKVQDIQEIVMVGGSTRVPLVIDTVKAFFKTDKVNNSLNPDQVVALGAAIEADILAGNRKDILLLDVTPLSLGIETLGGLMDVIIPRNNKIPFNAGRQYTTSKDGQTKLKITVYQGERELVKDNRELGTFTLENIPAMPAGLPKIDIQFLLNADGILKVQATELRSGTQQSITIQPQYGLTDQAVETMLLSAMQNAASDMQNRSLTESINEAKQVVYQCQKLLKNNAQLLSAEEISATQAAITELEQLCEGSDKEAIIQATERLNTISRPFAERLMDNAIAAALTGKSLDQIP